MVRAIWGHCEIPLNPSSRLPEEIDINLALRRSIANNPYYFSGPFSGAVAPAGMLVLLHDSCNSFITDFPSTAHIFIINFFSNHSAAVPGGTLSREVLKSFFSVTGEPGSFVYTPGQEKVPMNW